MNKAVKAVWGSFKTQPLKFGAGVMIISLSIYVFIGGIILWYLKKQVSSYLPK